MTGDGARERLLAERAEVEERLAAARADLERIMAAGDDVATDDEHDPDGIGLALERAHQVAVVQRGEEHLVRVEQALARVARGGYGRCEACGRPIAPARLEARPTATTCIDCAARGASPA